MLIAITLPLISETDATLPPYLGRAVYASTLARIQAINPELAREIHELTGPKPLTCSGLLNAPTGRQGAAIRAGQPYFVRVTGLTGPVSQALAAGLLTQPPQSWSLDGHPFQLEPAVCDEIQDAWSGRATYEALAAGQLLADQESRRVTLKFATPTAFKSQKMQVPIPSPGLLFGSLVERWNTFSPITLSPEMRRFGEEMVAISRYKLQSQPVPQKGGGVRIGGVGEVTYTALGGDRYWLGVMQMLADFARFSGVGVQTATGMGQVRRI